MLELIDEVVLRHGSRYVDGERVRESKGSRVRDGSDLKLDLFIGQPCRLHIHIFRDQPHINARATDRAREGLGKVSREPPTLVAIR